ncbi:hypothetical protein [Halorussus halophilus]|uniref:hypothetical protein n=1 Tax=Halorussus halophilus TaxID=2650975 RepID=UPI001CE41348|nr:hypothetical protein [Halorussus halophilus]
MGGSTLTVVVLYFGVVITAVVAGVPLARSGISVAGDANPTILFVIAALSFVLIGPMEELFFRGIVQETMREVLPRRRQSYWRHSRSLRFTTSRWSGRSSARWSCWAVSS